MNLTAFPQKNKMISANAIAELLEEHYTILMKEFYEMQSTFLSTRYKVHHNLETTCIIICFIRSCHLSIIRQREKNLDYNLSLNNFIYNLDKVYNSDAVSHKIVSIVSTTGIPKETVRRKLKKLVKQEFVLSNKHKRYYWYLSPVRRNNFIKIMKEDIKAIAKFISNISKNLNLNFTQKMIENEIEKEFSFYFYHFLDCQLTWLKMWQTKIKDIDLVFIAMQVLIPTLQYTEKDINPKNLGLNNLHKIIGHTNSQYKLANNAISATSISEVSGIPRATCIRKLDKLVKLGLLVREVKTKRYYVNQFTSDRTKHILKKDNIIFTIQSFSDFLSIVITALARKKR